MLSTTFWYLVPHFESIRYFTLGTLQKLASWSIVCTWQMGAFSCIIFPSLGHHCDGHRANIMPNLFILPFSSKHVCHVRLCNMSTIVIDLGSSFLVGWGPTLLFIHSLHILLSLLTSFFCSLISSALSTVLSPHLKHFPSAQGYVCI